MKQLHVFTEDGESPIYRNLRGKFCLAAEGPFGGGTLQAVFVDDNNNELTHNTQDWSFTGPIPFPQAFGFPEGVGVKFVMTGATSPNVVVSYAKFPD